MNDALAVAPAFAVVLAGFAAGRLGLVAAPGLAGLRFLVLGLAQPALLLAIAMRAWPSDDLSFSFVLTAAFASYCVFALGFTFAALRNGGDIGKATILALVGSQGYLLAFAPAIAAGVLGEEAAIPIVLVMAFDTLLLAVTGPLMMLLGGGQRPGRQGRAVLRTVLLNPLVLAGAVGLMAGAIALRLPGAVTGTIDLLGAAAPPAALFLLGAELSMVKARRPSGDVALAIALKLVAHPLAAYLLLGWVGDFPRPWVMAAVLAASLPSGLAAAALAARFGEGAVEALRGAFWGVAAGAVTTAIWVSLIANGSLPADPF